jgi:hypothetical protein
MSTPEPVEETMKLLGRLVDEMEVLMNQKKM